MHDDEEATHTRLAALLANAAMPAIAEHGGRGVKNTGDGFLAEFPSAVEAVRAAIKFQDRVQSLTIDDADDKQLLFRVGINIGDIIVEKNDIFGDGVNIAARLESIAEPGGVCISASAYDQVRGKVGVEFTDLGEQNLKNIARPVRAYGVIRDGLRPNTKAHRAILIPPSAPRLSIVVLPFANIGGDLEQDYFADGVTESLTTDLSRIRGSFVIARNTAFTFKAKVVDVKQIGRDLNVRYVLEGSVQRGGSRFRVNVQLIDAETGNHLWAERFDKPVADLFDMQDEIVSRLASTLNTQLIEAEALRAERSPNPDSIDLYFQGTACFHRGVTPELLARARGFFERALTLDPENIEALLGMALIDIEHAHLTDDRIAHLMAAETAAVRAQSMSPQHPLTHLVLGLVQMLTNRGISAVAEFEQTLALNPNQAAAHGCIGIAKYFSGHGAETEPHIREALRLSPLDQIAYRWLHFVGFAKLQLGDDAEAVMWMRRSVEANRNVPLSHFGLAIALALFGSVDEARIVAKTALALDPGFSIRRYRSSAPTDNPTYLAARERHYEALRIVGVPDG